MKQTKNSKIFFFLLILNSFSFCKIIYVSPNGENSNCGNNQQTPCSIYFANSISNNGDTISFLNGTYILNSTLEITSNLFFNSTNGLGSVILTSLGGNSNFFILLLQIYLLIL